MRFSTLSNLLFLGGALVNALDFTTAKARKLIPDSFHRHGQQVRSERRDVKERLSSIWSGAEVNGPRMASATAELTIPNITFPYGYNASTTYSSSVWVGIGGDQNTCDDPHLIEGGGLLQGGFYYLYDPQGDFGVFAFYEWFPSAPVFLDNTKGILTDIGDHVRMSVTQKDNVTGTYTWENFTKNQTFTIDLKAPSINDTLCTNHAEWIVESFMYGDDPDYFTDFGDLIFTEVEAITEAGEVAPLSAAEVITAQPILNGYNLTKCEILQPDAVKCKWLGYNNTIN